MMLTFIHSADSGICLCHYEKEGVVDISGTHWIRVYLVWKLLNQHHALVLLFLLQFEKIALMLWMNKTIQFAIICSLMCLFLQYLHYSDRKKNTPCLVLFGYIYARKILHPCFIAFLNKNGNFPSGKKLNIKKHRCITEFTAYILKNNLRRATNHPLKPINCISKDPHIYQWHSAC